MKSGEIVEYNRKAWNKQAKEGSCWSIPVEAAVIENARQGKWQVVLTPNKAVPLEWFGESLAGKKLLGLASGGGQQMPIFAAAGAEVTSFDNSDEQLSRDRLVAKRDGLRIETVQGDMADLSVFADASFDIIFHPVSNVFAQEIRPVWKECYRVLKPGGRLLSGFMNSCFFLFDHEEAEDTGVLQVKYRQPYSDLEHLDEESKQLFQHGGFPMEFGHSLEDQIGGQIAAGFSINGLYEDDWNDEATPLNQYCCMYIATLAIKAGG